MRLLHNMATGKGLAAILRPKTINLIGNNKLNKFSRGVLRQCSACQRHVVTIASTVGGWNREKSKLHPCALSLAGLHHSHFPMTPGAFHRRVNDLIACRVNVPIFDCPSYHLLHVFYHSIRAACSIFPLR